ncbi:hypothetical protein [Candidatus Kuenenia sp.]
MGEPLPMNNMHAQVKEIQKAADSNDGGGNIMRRYGFGKKDVYRIP